MIGTIMHKSALSVVTMVNIYAKNVHALYLPISVLFFWVHFNGSVFIVYHFVKQNTFCDSGTDPHDAIITCDSGRI